MPRTKSPNRNVTVPDARRLAIRAAMLAGRRPKPDRDGILEVVRGLTRLQIDPTRTVEKTHLLVLWGRLGAYDVGDLDRLLWVERRLFEWAAFIHPIEAYPEQRFLMDRFGTGDGPWQRRVREWLAANDRVRRTVMARLRREGPLRSRDFTAEAAGLTDWRSSGWTHGRNATQLFEFLHGRGEVMVAGRQGNERVWDVPERVLPPDTPTERLTDEAFADRRLASVVQRLGIATPSEIRVRMPNVERDGVVAAIQRAVTSGRLVEVTAGDSTAYARPDDLDGLGDPSDRRHSLTTLLSPFDQLIYDRDRTEQLFGFRYRLEMYVPKAKRQFGHFVLPILHGDRLIGRIDPLMDRRESVFRVNGLHLESDAPTTTATRAVRAAIEDLASWLGAKEVAYGEVPPAWRTALTG